MIERVIEFSIRNRFLVLLAGLGLALWGVYAVYHTPIDAIPDLSETQVIVFTEWLGHGPREIEDQVTYPVSLSLQGLGGVQVVRASSDFNFSMINVIFEDGVDNQTARRQVGERLVRAGGTLPPGVVPALAPDAPATGQIFWYTVEGAGHDLGQLRAIQDWYVRHQLNSVPGVAEVASVGGYPMEYQVEVDPYRLRACRVTLADVVRALSQANATVGGHVIQTANAEYIVRGVGWLGHSSGSTDTEFDRQGAVRDLEQVVLPAAGGGLVRVGDVARVALGPQYRRGVLEKDGNEVVGGVVLIRYGENPLAVTRRIREKMQEMQAGLPAGVRLVPFYDRTPLIEGAVRTVTATLIEAIITATVCVLIVLLHFRTSLIIAVTLPLATLASFATMWTLRVLGIADIQTNIMSLAGLAISIGVLVDSSIVMAENVMHRLHDQFGAEPVTGDVRELVLSACKTVGRPIFFSVMIMLLSFLPVFALGGVQGKMFRPLAFTKSFALAAVAVLSVTVVPALCTIFIKGRLRSEMESWVVRSVIRVYRPVLDYLLDRPAALAWFMGVMIVVGLAPLGSRSIFLTALLLALVGCAMTTRNWTSRAGALASLVIVALAADLAIQPLGYDAMTPLDEGMTMDMPITVPRISVTQAADDLKARDMIFCRFPEVDMVVGKAGRAETPTDPAPMDMIETMVNFRPRDCWPKRKLRTEDAERQGRQVRAALVGQGVIDEPANPAGLVNESVMAALPLFDALMREFAYQKNQVFQRDLGMKLSRAAIAEMVGLVGNNGSLRRELSAGDVAILCNAVPSGLGEQLALEPVLEDVTRLAQEAARKLEELSLVQEGSDVLRYQPNVLERVVVGMRQVLGGKAPTFFTRLQDAVTAQQQKLWREHVRELDGELFNRAATTFTRLVLEELVSRGTGVRPEVAAALQERKRIRTQAPARASRRLGHHHGVDAGEPGPTLDPQSDLDDVQDRMTRRFAGWLLLWQKERSDLAGFGGELDRVMQMPGWTNVWTMPIQNRVDMLSTGVNTAIGIRVLGRKLEDVVRASEEIAAVVKQVPGAADVIADPVRGKGYLEVHIDREKAARHGVSLGDINDVVETGLGGKVVTVTMEGRERHPVRVRFPRSWRDSEESVRNLLVPARGTPAFASTARAGSATPPPLAAGTVLANTSAAGAMRQVPLGQVADVRSVEGPATIKSDNGLPRNYVRLNVRGVSTLQFLDDARRAIASRVTLPAGVYLEWTGRFEHDLRASRSVLLITPLVLGLIFLILYLTYKDFADAALMMLAVPGAMAGGVFFQWLLGYNFSVTLWVGYIACFGMATSTGIIMLVYLREAIANAGGLENMTLEQIRAAVMDGAVHRLRPKLLTEGTIIIGLAPLLWANGTGAEVIKPMTAPVLGGILFADEVIDLFLPVLFYRVRRRRWERLQRLDSCGKPQTSSV